MWHYQVSKNMWMRRKGQLLHFILSRAANVIIWLVELTLLLLLMPLGRGFRNPHVSRNFLPNFNFLPSLSLPRNISGKALDLLSSGSGTLSCAASCDKILLLGLWLVALCLASFIMKMTPLQLTTMWRNGGKWQQKASWAWAPTPHKFQSSHVHSFVWEPVTHAQTQTNDTIYLFTLWWTMKVVVFICTSSRSLLLIQ